jgi:hypothetical protein
MPGGNAPVIRSPFNLLLPNAPLTEEGRALKMLQQQMGTGWTGSFLVTGTPNKTITVVNGVITNVA